MFDAIMEQVYILVGSCQHDFMAKRSCVTQLVEVFDLIGSQLEKGGQVDIIFLDMSKAFDKVSHRKVLTLLQEHGFGFSKPSSECNRIGCVFGGTPCNFLSAQRFNLRPYAVSLLCESPA